MKKYLQVFFVLGAFLLPNSAKSQDLQEIFALIENFGNVEAARNAAAAAQAKLRAGKASYLPQIDLKAMGAINSQSIDMFEPKHAAAAELDATWLAYDAARDAAISALAAASEQAAAASEQALSASKLAAAKSYYARAAAASALEAQSAQCAAISRSAEDMSALVAAGIKESSELQMLEAAAASCAAQMASTQAKIASYDAALSALAGEQIIADGQRADGSKSDELGQITTQLLQNASGVTTTQEALNFGKSGVLEKLAIDAGEDFTSPETKQAQAALALAIAGEESAKAAYAPKVFIKNTAAYKSAKLHMQNFGPLRPVIEQNAKSSSFSNSLMLGAQVNIFAGGAHKAAQEAAKLARLAASSQLAAAIASQNAELNAAKAELAAASAQLNAANAARISAEKAAANISEKFAAGLANYSDFLRSQAALAGAKSTMAAASAAAGAARAQIAYLRAQFAKKENQ